MIYENLFASQSEKQIKAGLIGTGTYGISLLMQTQFISRLDIVAVCDKDPELAEAACRQAGISEDKIVIYDSRKKLLQALEKEKCAITDNPELVIEAPIDVLVECTGNPEAGARHAELAIQNGKHVAMVTKETDAVIGPILCKLADQAGVIYTPVDGDQHGLLIGLVSWAKSIGLDVVCGGKARPYDFVYDEARRTVSNGVEDLVISKEEVQALQKIQPQEARSIYEIRRNLFRQWPQIAEADLCESVIAANATSLLVDTPSLHAPIVRTVEIPEVLCPKEEGGILSKKGVIDVITCLRHEDEAGLGGGVFLVFSCKNDDAWEFVKDKGLLTNHRGTCGVVYRPYHLLGVETPISILCAGLLNLSTGSLSYKPRADLVGKAKKDLKAGSSLQFDRGKSGDLFEHLIVPFAPIDKDRPIPFYMAVGNQLKADVPAGSILTCGMIKEPENSRLWDLRKQQDRVFLQ
jgi:predicted homoserine dehydrogenase-like protein